jgi:hypothetical protein
MNLLSLLHISARYAFVSSEGQGTFASPLDVISITRPILTTGKLLTEFIPLQQSTFVLSLMISTSLLPTIRYTSRDVSLGETISYATFLVIPSDWTARMLARSDNTKSHPNPRERNHPHARLYLPLVYLLWPLRWVLGVPSSKSLTQQ